MNPNIDRRKLTPDQVAQLESWQVSHDQLGKLEEIAAMAQEMVTMLGNDEGKKNIEGLGSLLVDIRESLTVLKDKEAPEMPDYAKPVVDAVSKLETALTASLKAISQDVHVAAPEVTVNPQVDLKGVEKVMKTLPKAFKDAISAIPQTEIPETNFDPLVEMLSNISTQLESLERVARMKPTPPKSMIVTNPDGSSISGGSSLPAAVVAGQQTVTNTASALPSGPLTQGVIFESLSSNTVAIYVGPSGVTTTTGVELQPGAALSAAVNDLSKLFVVCASSAPVITWLGS